MKIRTVAITVPAARDTVFQFLARIENLPQWATEFCSRVEQRGPRWIAITSQGELVFEIAADAGTGVVDLRAGPAPEQLWLFPMRVFALPSGGTAVMFTFPQPPDLPLEIYERQYASLLVEMRGLIARFGGGEL